MDREMRPVDAAEFFGAGMDVHEGRLRRGNRKQRVALARHFPEPAADQDDEIGRLDPRQQLRIGPDAEIAGITGVQRMKQVGAAEAGRDRHRELLGEARDRLAPGLRPPAAAENEDRALGLGDEVRQFAPSPPRPARSPPAGTAAHPRPRPARPACPREARSPPGRDGRWSPHRRRATRSPGPARDRRSRSPIWSWCRTRRGNRAPGTPRARASRAPPGRRTRSSARSPAARCGCPPTRWWRPDRG